MTNENTQNTQEYTKEEVISDLKSDKKFAKIYAKINDIETHIINLIHPIQALHALVGPEKTLASFIRQFSDPIPIDDTRLINSVKEFMTALDNYSKGMNLRALIDAFMNISLMKHELQGIGDRLLRMESMIESIHENGFKVEITAQIEKKAPAEKEVKKTKGRSVRQTK